MNNETNPLWNLITTLSIQVRSYLLSVISMLIGTSTYSVVISPYRIFKFTCLDEPGAILEKFPVNEPETNSNLLSLDEMLYTEVEHVTSPILLKKSSRL